YDSDTSLALLSGAPFDDPSWWLLSNEQIVKAREIINDFAGSRRLLAHSVITPKQPGWMEEVDKAIAVYKPDSWKSYTIGDPLAPSKYPWRLDDEQVMCADHIMWGTDSVWYGSPQWQIEAMRRLEIPEDMQKKYGFPALGGADSATKQLIFGANAA